MPIHLLAATSLLLLASPLAASSDGEFVAWARGLMVPLDAAGEVWKSLDAELDAARVIGVGESVHEVETFFAFRTQLLRDLVQRHRVTALVLESGLPEVMAVDDYVRGRTATVDLDAALPGGLGPYAETRRAVEWLREWNLGAGREHPVGVYGADLPGRSGSLLPALDRLQELTAGEPGVKPLIDAVRPLAEPIADTWWRGAAEKYDALSVEAKALLTASVDALVEAVQRLSAGDADRERRERARRVARVLQQGETTLRLGPFSPTVPRDQALAENTLWVLARLAAGERAVYWAHNAHVQRVPVEGPKLPPGRFVASGTRLVEALGDAYYAIGTAYGGPALDDESAAAEGSVDGALEGVAQIPFLLTLRSGPRPDAVATWLAQQRPMRFQVGTLVVPLGSAFDAVVYFDHAVPAVRAPSAP